MSATLIDKAVLIERRAEEIAERVAKRMSKPGKLGLPPLLEERRLRYGLTDGCFRVQAAFDRVFVYQIEQFEGETYEGGKIIRTAVQRKREQNEAPRGVLVSAGLKALDALRSNGIDLGFIVTFAHYVVGTMVVDMIDGHPIRLAVMNAGHISGSEDTRELMRKGQLRIEHNDNDEHFFVRGKRRGALPVMPWMAEDI